MYYSYNTHSPTQKLNIERTVRKCHRRFRNLLVFRALVRFYLSHLCVRSHPAAALVGAELQRAALPWPRL